MTQSSPSDQTQRATQEDFDKEVKRVQSLLEHLQQHAAQFKFKVVSASPEAAERLHRAEALLEETQRFHELVALPRYVAVRRKRFLSTRAEPL